MRLLKDEGHGILSLVERNDGAIPQYAILSHTWGAEEVTLKDIIKGTGKNKAGYEKIEFCRKQAASDGLLYFWVDTCCIDKSSSAELSEAINSMFRWYQNADKCYVYLSNMSTSGYATDPQLFQTTWIDAFRNSRWFYRGWTLQELIAPASVEFFSREGDRLGSKESLEQDIHEITGIAVEALRGGSLLDFTVKERMSWADRRRTERPEDGAYSLLGIFNIRMRSDYGEGRQNAFERLQRKIEKFLNPPVQQPEILPSPSSTLPFRRDDDFVDRKTLHDCGTLLEQIEKRCAFAASRVALVGIGGAGKSQLIIEYCHRLRARSPEMWVFWIYASNIDRIEQGYHEIAEQVKIPGRTDPKVNIFELVLRWLRDETKGRWVLVMDNLDDDTLLSIPHVTTPRAQSGEIDGQLRRPLSAYLPQSQNGTLLITTRTRIVATKLVDPRDIISVEPMNDTDAIELLQKKLDGPRDKHDLKELASILEHMPLAIVQAAAYMQEKGPKYSVRQYIEVFQQSEKRKISLLNYEAGHLRRDPEAKNSIIITWQISFNDIRKRWPPSADLLSLMSYFDRQGIPEEVLKVKLQGKEIRDSTELKEYDKNDERKNIRDDSLSEKSEDDMFEEAIGRLRSYLFVSTGADGRTFEMHGLVQLATRKWLEMHGRDERWKAQFCMKLNAMLPSGNHENWDRCAMLFPHAKSAEKQRPTQNRLVREWAQILRKAGWYALAKGNYREAERMCEKSAEALGTALGGEDVETSYSLAMLASTFSNQGRWAEAEKIQVQVMETSRKVLGEEHPGTLSCIANLASTYLNQGRWAEAETIQMQLMETSRRVLGEEHPDTLSSMANLAATYWDQGRWAEAETIQVQVMETSRKVLGEEHPGTLISMANLASTYLNQGRWAEAETIQMQVMETSRKVLGEEHPSTLISMANLAATYRNRGRLAEAETIQVQVMEKSRRVLGEEHPDTLSNLNNLAFTMKELGRKWEATKLMTECVELCNRVLGTEHPHALSAAAALTKWQNVE